MTKSDFILQSVLLQSATNLSPDKAVERAERFYAQYEKWVDRNHPHTLADAVIEKRPVKPTWKKGLDGLARAQTVR